MNIGFVIFGAILLAFAYLALTMNYESYVRKQSSTEQVVKIPWHEPLLAFVSRYARLLSAVEQVAGKFYKGNSVSMEANIVLALGFWLIILAATVISGIFCFALTPLWYLGLMYFLIVVGMGIIFVIIFLSSFDFKFMSEFPEALKLLGSRLGMYDDVLFSLQETVADTPPAMAKFLGEIRSALTQAPEIANQKLEQIRKDFNNKYATTTLTILKTAHESGGIAIVQEEFNSLVEDAYFEIENVKDIRLLSTTYIRWAVIIVPTALFGIEYFSKYGEGTTIPEYYTSPDGYMMKLIALLAMVAYVGMIKYMDSQKVS